VCDGIEQIAKKGIVNSVTF